MKIMPCPLNGPRNIQEFICAGPVEAQPDPNRCTDDEWSTFVWMEENRAGVVREWWCHAATSYWFIAERNTVTDEILATYPADRVFDKRVTFDPPAPVEAAPPPEAQPAPPAPEAPREAPPAAAGTDAPIEAAAAPETPPAAPAPAESAADAPAESTAPADEAPADETTGDETTADETTADGAPAGAEPAGDAPPPGREGTAA